MRSRIPAIVAVTLLVLAALGGCAREDEVELTSIEDILSGRVADGEQVTIEGTVVASRPRPAVDRVTYDISADNQTLPVVTEQAAPPLAEALRIEGTVRVSFVVGDVDLGTVLEEASRGPVGGESREWPLWVWAASGGGALLVVLAVIIVLARRKRSRGEGMPCPHCGAATEPDWVVCTECGRRLDAAPSAPETMISAPPPPPGPSPDEIAEKKRRSASTILLPPGEDSDYS
jgi:hypothetical protein